MATQIDSGDVEIESSTDTVEQVQEALGSAIEIEESPSAEEAETPAQEAEQPPAKPSKEAKTEDAEEEATESGETTTEEETEQTEEEEQAEEKKEAKPKAADTIPRARLNKEIARRKDLERQLREKLPALLVIDNGVHQVPSGVA